MVTTGLVAVASLLLLLAGGASAATLALYNKCGETVWPGIQPGAGKEILARGGLQLLPNRVTSIRLPTGWSGRVWGRQGCRFDAAGRGKCATGDCGGALYCNGAGGELHTLPHLHQWCAAFMRFITAAVRVHGLHHAARRRCGWPASSASFAATTITETWSMYKAIEQEMLLAA